MTSGGARGRSGPPPDPTALRRDRKSDQATWTTLPKERTAPAPDWPLTISPSPAEQAHWDALWRSPQATEWEKSGIGAIYEVAVHVRSLAETEIPGAAANLRTLVKQQQEGLGLSLVGLAVRRWRIADDSPAIPTAATASGPAARPARTRPSARDRFKVVPAPKED